MNFLLECYFKSENGILFLNNKVVYNYFMRFEVEEKSLTKNINFRLVDDSLKAYKASSELCDKYNIKNKSLFLNPYLLNWLNLWLSRENTKEELRKVGFSFPDSKTNFLFATHDDLDIPKLFEYLREKNIYVRHWSIPAIDNRLRITIGTDLEMQALLKEIKAYMEKN